MDTPGDNRLRPEERIRKQAELEAVFETRQSAGNRLLVMHWRANTLGHARLGIVIGRRYGNAVARNLFKRRVREIFRNCKQKLGPLDLLLLPGRHEARRGRPDFEQLKESFLKLAAKIVNSSQMHNGSKNAGS